jgi:hypothetical protein
MKLVKEGGSGALGFAFVVAACVESVGLHPAEVNLYQRSVRRTSVCGAAEARRLSAKDRGLQFAE